MGFFDQFADVIEWAEYRDDVLFWVWRNNEIKKGSRLVIKPGQDAVFIYNGRIEGIFKDEGNFEVSSEIIPFLSTLKGFKFGFNSGLRAQVMFVNTKELLVKWGTKNAINIPTPNMPGGLPIRSFGTCVIKAVDYISLIDKIAGIKEIFTLNDVSERIISSLDQLLMKWISKEGKDMFNLQMNAHEISSGIKGDLDIELLKMGISVVDFTISSFNYPPEVQEMINKNAAYGMVGDVSRFRDIGMVEAATNGKGGAMADSMGSMVGIMAGMNMVREMSGSSSGNYNTTNPNNNFSSAPVANFCPGCGTKLSAPGANFCSACGYKLN